MALQQHVMDWTRTNASGSFRTEKPGQAVIPETGIAGGFPLFRRCCGRQFSLFRGFDIQTVLRSVGAFDPPSTSETDRNLRVPYAGVSEGVLVWSRSERAGFCHCFAVLPGCQSMFEPQNRSYINMRDSPFHTLLCAKAAHALSFDHPAAVCMS